MKALSITALCLCLLAGTSCVTSRQGAGYVKPIHKIYENQRLKNETARRSQSAEELKTALNDTEKNWQDTISFLGASEKEKADCQSEGAECAGKLSVYRYLTFLLGGLILLYFALKLSPLRHLFPVLFIALPLLSFSARERSLHAMELAGIRELKVKLHNLEAKQRKIQ